VWIALLLAIQAGSWSSGFRPAVIASAIDEGSARVETQSLGEVEDEVVRKAIQTQRATLAFWSTLVGLGDFLVDPLFLVIRASLVSVAFASLAALRGKPIQLGRTLDESARLQGFWVLGPAVQLALMVLLRRTQVETSAVLLLAPGEHPGWLWAVLSQFEAFVLLGWVGLVAAAVGRGQARVVGAVLVALSLWTLELAIRVGGSLVVEAGMRVAILPQG
jgi:hypothetical protein